MTPIAQLPAGTRNAAWACRPQPAAVSVRAFSNVAGASARSVASTASTSSTIANRNNGTGTRPKPAATREPPTAPSRRLTAVAAVATPTHRGPQPSPMTNPETGCVIDARIPEKVSDTGQCRQRADRRSSRSSGPRAGEHRQRFQIRLRVDQGRARAGVTQQLTDLHQTAAAGQDPARCRVPQPMVVPTSAQPSLCRPARYADLDEKVLLRPIRAPERVGIRRALRGRR
jgi:hypothetical protein